MCQTTESCVTTVVAVRDSGMLKCLLIGRLIRFRNARSQELLKERGAQGAVLLCRLLPERECYEIDERRGVDREDVGWSSSTPRAPSDFSTLKNSVANQV